MPFSDAHFYYATGTLPAGLHYFKTRSNYIIYISGEINGAAYGYIPAFNSM